jgi:hypothetical protein
MSDLNLTDREKCPSCGMPTIIAFNEGLTTEERMCQACYDRDFPEDKESAPLTPYGEALALLGRFREREQNHYALVDSAVAYGELPPCHHAACVICDTRAFLDDLYSKEPARP